MAPYLLVFFISSFFFYLASNRRKEFSFYSFLALIIPSLLACFRNLTVGTDTEIYYITYNMINDNSISNLNIELSYLLISYIAKFFGGFPVVLFIYQFLTICFIYKVAFRFKEKISVWLVLFLYYCFFFNNSLNIMRQCLAASFVVYISTFLYDNKKNKFLLYSLFSMFLHSSSIVGCFFLYLIYKLNYLSKSNRIILLFIYIVFLFIIFWLFKSLGSFLTLIEYGRFNAYNDYINSAEGVISYTDFTYRIIYLLLSIYAIKNTLISKKIFFLYLFLLLTDVFLLLLGLYNVWISRLGFYTSFYHIFFLSLIFNSKKITYESKIFFQIIIAFLGLIYWYYIFCYRGSSATVPYLFF